MPTLSVAMIARNEADNIRNSLESVAWSDQIVFVDCASTDGTAQIAKDCLAEVHLVENNPNLNVNKNIAIDRCNSDWILVLDADEVIPDNLAGEIRRVISEGVFDGFFIPRRNFVLGKWLKRGSQYPDHQLRLFRKKAGRFPEQHIHEKVSIQGKVGYLSIPFDHHPYPFISSFVKKTIRDSEFEATHLYRSGYRVGGAGLMLRLFLIHPSRFFRRWFLKGSFLEGTQAFIRQWFDLMNQNLRWIRLWELSRQEYQSMLSRSSNDTKINHK